MKSNHDTYAFIFSIEFLIWFWCVLFDTMHQDYAVLIMFMRVNARQGKMVIVYVFMKDSIQGLIKMLCTVHVFTLYVYAFVFDGIIKFQSIYDRICHCECNWNHFRGFLICYLSFDDQWMIHKENNIPAISNSLMLFVVIRRKINIYMMNTFGI